MKLGTRKDYTDYSIDAKQKYIQETIKKKIRIKKIILNKKE